MNRKRFEDPIEALRRADPLDRLEVPTDTSEAHARALFQEITDMNTTETQEPAPRRLPKRTIGWAAAAALAVAAAAIGAYALFVDKAEPRIVGGEPIGGGGMAMCIQYDDAILAEQDMAFDGTLIQIEGNEVTFEVHRWFRGGDAAQVTFDAEGLVGGPTIAMDGIPFEEGQRYLVSGTDGFVWSCGYTVTFDSDLADHWAELFGA